ncbi:putative ribonuclease H domain-containing protein [Arabidopsis thaliana]
MLKGFTRSSTSPQLCSLYFKGLVGDDSLARFGVAICGHRDDILFQLNAPIHGSDITVLEAELMALKRGLMEAAEGFKSSFPIFVEGSSIRYVSELARATIVSELSISVDPPSSSLNGIEKLKLEDVVVWNVVNPYASTAKFGKSENVASMWKVPTHD